VIVTETEDTEDGTVYENVSPSKKGAKQRYAAHSVLTESHSREIHFSPMEIDTVFAADNSNQHHNKSNVRNDGKVFVETR